MAFTGKATYSAGSTLPEIYEDVSDVVGIVSPYETPLLDHLGDPRREAQSTVHEWLEDSLNPTTTQINQTNFTPAPTTAVSVTVDDASVFREGDLVRPGTSREVMLVIGVSGSTLALVRGYGGTTPAALANDMELEVIGNAALEGADKGASRQTNRTRQRNYTQIFTAPIEVSGSQRSVNTIGIEDELEYQKQERLRELLRDLEKTVINGVAAVSNPQGNSATRRTMAGLLSLIETNTFEPGVGAMPDGGGSGSDELTEELLNAALRAVWESSSGSVDTLLVGGAQKRRINSFASQLRGYQPGDTTFSDMVSVYESDFGVCRVVLSRWVPSDAVIMLDSSRASVMPLAGRSFQYKQLASTGDADCGMMLGEYTLQLMNESAHGVLDGLAV